MANHYEIMLVALQAVVRLALVILAGAALQANDWLPGTVRHALSRLVFTVFLPSLVSANIAMSLSLSRLVVLAGLVVFATAAHFLGAAVGWAAYAAFKLIAPSRYGSPVLQSPLFTACAALGNPGYLALSLVPTVLGMDPFGGQRDAGRDSTVAVAYIAMYVMALNMLSETFVNGLVEKQKHCTQGALNVRVAQVNVAHQHRPVPCLRIVLRPPVIACICGTIFGLVAPLKSVLFSEPVDDGDGQSLAPLEATLVGALESFANCTGTVLLLSLGASMTDIYRRQYRSRRQPGVAAGASCCRCSGGASKPPGSLKPPCAVEGADHAKPEPTSRRVITGFPAVCANFGVTESAIAHDSADHREVLSTQRSRHRKADLGSSEEQGKGGHVVHISQADHMPQGHQQRHISSSALAAGSSPTSSSSCNSETAADCGTITASSPLLTCLVATKLVLLPALGTALVSALVYAKLLPLNDPVLVFVMMIQFALPPAMNLEQLGKQHNFAQAVLGQVVFLGHVTAVFSLFMWVTVQLTVVQHLVHT